MTKEEKIALAKNCKVPTPEIKQDIADTEYEITVAESEANAYEVIGDKMSLFRAQARRDTNKRRREFIEKLQAILEIRAEIEITVGNKL